MTLRWRLFLLVAGLAVLLVAAQLWLVRTLAERLDRDVRVVAARVGEQLLSGFEFRTGREPAPPAPESSAADDEDEGNGRPRARVLVLPPVGEAKPVAGEEPHWVVRREWTETESGEDGQGRRFEFHVVEETTGPPVAPDGGPGASRGKGDDEPAPETIFVHGGAPDGGFRIPLRIPRHPVVSTLDRFGSELAVGSLAILALGLAIAAVVVHRTTAPLAELAGAARRIGAGELGVSVAGARRDEVGEAVSAFNAMSARLVELDAENRRLAEAERLSELGEVARGLAHTLRNPLNALGLSLDELGRGAGGARGAELAEAGRRQIRRMDGALRSFLALASASAAEAETVDVAEVAREVALEALQDGGGGVRVEVVAPAPAPISGVPAELRAILQALVVNAVEASPAGGRVAVRVERRDGGSGGRARVVVEDEGPGMPPEVRSRLFAPHVTTKPHGSGMGLFLTQRLLAGRYGGGLAFEDRAPAGTRAVAELGDRRSERGVRSEDA